MAEGDLNGGDTTLKNDTLYGAKEIVMKDPAGHIVTFAQYGAPAQH